jgi:hypothetical protein
VSTKVNYGKAAVQFHRPSHYKKWHGVMPPDATTYTNLATDKLINIITLMFNTKCLDTNIKQQIMNFSNIILNQNYFQYKEKLYTRNRTWDGCPHINFFPKFTIYQTQMLLIC